MGAGSILFLVSLVFGYLPILMVKLNIKEHVMGYCNCFSGGLLLSIGLIHIMPEALEMRSKITQSTFPLCFCLVLASFCFMLLLDKVIFNFVNIHNHKINLKKSIMGKNSDDPESNYKQIFSRNYKMIFRLSQLKKKRRKSSYYSQLQR